MTHIPVYYRKEVGKNAYMDNMGRCQPEWLLRVRTQSGLEGLTTANWFMRAPGGSVAGVLDVLRGVMLGRSVDELLELEGNRVAGVGASVRAAFRDHSWLSNAAFDLVGRARGTSCVDMLGGRRRDWVQAYDTTMYFQDFLDPERGTRRCADEAREALAAGYAQMKIKVGRGGRWMLPEVGMRRDIDVVLAIRDAVGPDFTLMVDANFGYDERLDLLEDFVRETAPANIFWFEEMVTASVRDYERLREMQTRYAPDALLVCGEVDRNPISPVFQDLIDLGLIDGYQPDIVRHGLAGWMELENRLAGTGVRSIPHNCANGRYGTRLGVVFGTASETFVTFEDERQFDHVYMPDGIEFRDGAHRVGDGPGLDLTIDEDVFQREHAHNEAVVIA